MTGGGWAEWSESQAGAAAATPQRTAEGGKAAMGAARGEGAAEVQEALAVGWRWACLLSSVGPGLAEKLPGELRSLMVALNTLLGV